MSTDRTTWDAELLDYANEIGVKTFLFTTEVALMEECKKEMSEGNTYLRQMKLASKMQLHTDHGVRIAIGEDPELGKAIMKGEKILHEIDQNKSFLDRLANVMNKK